VPVTLALLMGCELAVGLDQLDNQQCQPDEKPCEKKCFKLFNANTGCGGSSCTPCYLPHQSATCVLNGAGQYECRPALGESCDPGYDNCIPDDPNDPNTAGCETDTGHSVNNCGSCNHPCAPQANAFPGCSQGACMIQGCEPGYADCDGHYDTGCETRGACSM
jgi:hypothetical protein